MSGRLLRVPILSNFWLSCPCNETSCWVGPRLSDLLLTKRIYEDNGIALPWLGYKSVTSVLIADCLLTSCLAHFGEASHCLGKAGRGLRNKELKISLCLAICWAQIQHEAHRFIKSPSGFSFSGQRPSFCRLTPLLALSPHQQVDPNMKASYVSYSSRKGLSFWRLDTLDLFCKQFFSEIFKCMIFGFSFDVLLYQQERRSFMSFSIISKSKTFLYSFMKL